MGSITGHKKDYNGAGALRGQRHIPSKTEPKYPPPPPGSSCSSRLCIGPMEQKLEKPEVQTNEPGETPANKEPSERTDSRMTELTIKQSIERTSAKMSEKESERTNQRK